MGNLPVKTGTARGKLSNFLPIILAGFTKISFYKRSCCQ